MDEKPKWAKDFKASQPQDLDLATGPMQLSPVPISVRAHPTPTQHSSLQQLPGRTGRADLRIRPAIDVKPARFIHIKVIKSDITLTVKVQKLLKSIIILQPWTSVIPEAPFTQQVKHQALAQLQLLRTVLLEGGGGFAQTSAYQRRRTRQVPAAVHVEVDWGGGHFQINFPEDW